MYLQMTYYCRHPEISSNLSNRRPTKFKVCWISRHRSHLLSALDIGFKFSGVMLNAVKQMF